MDAADTSTITASSGVVSQWNDKSGNGHNVFQATQTRQPQLGSRTHNGIVVPDFDGADDQISSGAVFGDIGTTRAVTQFAVIKSDRTTAPSEGIVSAQRTGYDYLTGWLMERREGSLGLTITNGVNNYNAATFANTSTNPLVFSVRVSAGSGTKDAYVGGVPQTLTTFSGSMTNADFMSGGSGNHTIHIGNRGTANGAPYNNPFDGWIGEVLIFPRQLSPVEHQQVLVYLNGKWGL